MYTIPRPAALAAGLVLACGLGAPRIPAQEFEVFDLDGSGLLSLGAAFRISESGIAAGLGNPIAGSGDTQAVTWTSMTSTILSPLAGDESSSGYDVSETGIVVGESDDIDRSGRLIRIFPRAVIWNGGQPTDLATLVTGGAQLELFEANRINERGLILGTGRDAAISRLRAFVFDSGVVTDLGALTPTGGTDPFDMNEQGHVVGSSEAALGVDHAFVWRNGVMADLHDPAVILGRCSTARAINEAGVIVGSADFIPGGIQLETAAIWDHGQIISLGTLAGQQSYARDINEHGTVVGTTTWSGSGVHAFIYRKGVMEDLNDLIPAGSGWVLANAHDVTNDGRIVGEGFNNGLRPFLLVPDCDGGFQVYGTGCAGSGGFSPALWGEGCPEPRGDVSLAISNGLGGAPSVLLFGAGTGVATLTPGCQLQTLPLFPLQLPLALGGSGSGAGSWQIGFRLPGGIGAGSLYFQAVHVDPGGAGSLTVTNPLRMDFQ